jgi:nucleotide-binding universal stress UspA family protein
VNLQKENGSGPTILCLIDFSESSRKSVEWAMGMAKKLEADLTVVYPYRLDVAGKREDVVQGKKDRDTKAVRDFEKMTKDILKDDETKCEFFSEVGFIPDRVEEHVRKRNVLFVVMMKDFALPQKEVFTELLERIQVPLVVIPV